jgi:cyclopropane fatty-acyl-phospholipid synthase-like methyltransferase
MTTYVLMLAVVAAGSCLSFLAGAQSESRKHYERLSREWLRGFDAGWEAASELDDELARVWHVN